MADDRYDIIPWRGFRFDRYTVHNILRAEKKLGRTLRVMQGSYNRGGVSASAGTHDGGGAVDFAVAGLSSAQINATVKALRTAGFAAWFRPAIRGLWGPHIHAILIGNTKASSGAKNQVSAYRRFRDGLAGNRADLSWHPHLITNAPYKKREHIRLMTFNLPGEDKLGNVDKRVAKAAQLVNAANVDIVGWNEWVGRKTNGTASDFSKKVDKALGPKWSAVIPTTDFNENYLSYDSSKVKLVKRYPDVILRHPTGGRHVTIAVFKHKKTGKVLVVGQVHLVNGSTANHEAGRQAQGKAALAAVKAVAAKHKNSSYVVQGDMNTSAAIAALVNDGAKWTRRLADVSRNRDAATYTNYAKAMPAKNGTQIIDHQYVSRDMYVVGYTVEQNLTSSGTLATPRASDHFPVLSSVYPLD